MNSHAETDREALEFSLLEKAQRRSSLPKKCSASIVRTPMETRERNGTLWKPVDIEVDLLPMSVQCRNSVKSQHHLNPHRLHILFRLIGSRT